MASLSAANRCSWERPISSTPMLTTRLLATRRSRPIRAIRSASARTTASSSSAGAVLDDEADVPGFGARDGVAREARGASSTAGPRWYSHMLVGGTPMERTGGNPMRASSAATTRSQCRARSVPPARQFPCTWAMTGSGAVPDPGPPVAEGEHGRHVALDRRVLGEVAGVGVLGDEAVARGERSPGAADDDDAHAGVGLRLVHRGRELADAAGRQRVVMIRAVQRQPPDHGRSVRRVNVEKLVVTPGRLQAPGGT